jgi:hypothetical protein
VDGRSASRTGAQNNSRRERRVYELIPILGGLLAGLGAARAGRPAAGLALVSGTACTIGPFAAAVSGELSESWAFLLWDAAQVLAVGLLTYAAASRVASWRSHAPALRADRASPTRPVDRLGAGEPDRRWP